MPKGRTISLESAAAAGIVFSVIAWVSLVLLSDYPRPGEGDDAVRLWFDDGGNRATLIVGANLATISSVAFLWFVGVFRRRFGPRENRFVGTAFFGSALLFVATWLGGAAALAAPAVSVSLLDATHVDAGSASLSAGLGGTFLLVIAPRFQAVFVFATANLIHRSDTIPQWLVPVSLITGVGLFVVPIVTRPVGLLFPGWVLLSSITLLLTRPKGDVGTDQAEPHAEL